MPMPTLGKKSPLLYRIVDLMSKKIPGFVYKHPALVATAAGVGLGSTMMGQAAENLEGDIMRERMGYPSEHYASAELTKFAEHKMNLAVKLSFEKVAIDQSFSDMYTPNFVEGLGSGVSKSVASEGIGAIRRLIGATAQSISENLFAKPERMRIVDTIVQNDPDVAAAEENNPGQAHQTFQTMSRVAPMLSRDPNVVASFLRNAAMTGGVLDYNTVKGLADAEAAVQRAKNEGAWLRGGF